MTPTKKAGMAAAKKIRTLAEQLEADHQAHEATRPKRVTNDTKAERVVYLGDPAVLQAHEKKLRMLAFQAKEAREALHEAVVTALMAGLTQGDIAMLLGVSRQAVGAKFAPRLATALLRQHLDASRSPGAAPSASTASPKPRSRRQPAGKQTTGRTPGRAAAASARTAKRGAK